MRKFTEATTDEALENKRVLEAKQDAISVIEKQIHNLATEGYTGDEIKTMLSNLVDSYGDFQAI